MIYGYARVSTAKQKEDRQLIELEKHGVAAIFTDKQSGKDFDRDQYRLLLSRLMSGDVLFIKSLDRLGRNYKEVLEQWRIITKVKGADVVVLDMPLLDTRKEKNLLGTFISDIVLQILAFVAESERAYINQRAREGVAAAKTRGVKFGRPRRTIPNVFEELAKRVVMQQLPINRAAQLCNIPCSTFRRYLAERSKNGYIEGDN